MYRVCSCQRRRQNRDGGVTVSLGAKGWWSLSSSRPVRDGARGRSTMCTRASPRRPRWIRPAGTWCRRSTLSSRRMAIRTGRWRGSSRRPSRSTDEQKEDDRVTYAARTSESDRQDRRLASSAWVRDVRAGSTRACLARGREPTINIEGLVAGYTGPGGKTVLPHRAEAKIDMRLAPDMTAADTLAKLKAHLAKHGFGDIEVNISGGYDPNADRAQKQSPHPDAARDLPPPGDRILNCGRGSAGSWPGYVFTDPFRSVCRPGTSGMGHGSGAHAPDEYSVIDSTNPNVQGIDGADRLVRGVSLRARMNLNACRGHPSRNYETCRNREDGRDTPNWRKQCVEKHRREGKHVFDPV